jgi:hypothetical protein
MPLGKAGLRGYRKTAAIHGSIAAFLKVAVRDINFRRASPNPYMRPL